MNNVKEKERLSIALASIVGGESTVDGFFQDVWQRSCRVYRCGGEEGHPLQQQTFQWDDRLVKENPFHEMIRNGWVGLVAMVEQAQRRYEKQGEEEDARHQDDPSTMLPLVFHDKQTLSPEYVHSTYGVHNILFMAYLDGCSIVLNHADWTCPYMAALCLDLQESLPHAYANAYLTPPSSQAVPPHADDRDVLVIQLVGRKHWKVYETVPIPYPYPPEQVGKEGLMVPPRVLSGPCVVDTILKPGDVLYMPRGYVHEARTLETDLSFHVTIALATHDWSLGRIITTAVQQSLDSTVEYRKAIEPISLGMQPTETLPPAQLQHVHEQVHDALELVKKRLTVESIGRHLQNKYARHNQRALSQRMQRIKEVQNPEGNSSLGDNETVVGRGAAKRTSLQSILRVATAQEKAMGVSTLSKPTGLHVRPETSSAIMTILEKLRTQSNNETNTACRVSELSSLLSSDNDNGSLLCHLTLLSFAKCCVEMGALALVEEPR